MNTDDLFEFNAPTTVTELKDMADTYDDGADQFFDTIFGGVEGAKSEPNFELFKQEAINDCEENKENFVPGELNDNNISNLAHQLIRSARKSRKSKLLNRPSITVEGIEVDLPRIKHHAMITRLDELENTPKIQLRTRSVVKSEYKFEHLKSGSHESLMLDKSSKKFMSIAEKVRNFFNNTPPRYRSKPSVTAGSKVLKPRKLMASCPPESSNTKAENKVENPHNIKRENVVFSQTHVNHQVHASVTSSAVKMPATTEKIKVLNSLGGVQIIENKELGHGGIKVLEKQLHTVPKPFSFQSRKSVAVKPQKTMENTDQWVFKARPATVLKIKPFVPKTHKKYTEAKNIRLNTERRAQEWIVFEQEMKEKFSNYAEISKQKQEEQQKREMEMIKNMRQQTVHKPEPIKKYKPVLIKKCERPLTIPNSPRFSIRPAARCGMNSTSHQ